MSDSETDEERLSALRGEFVQFGEAVVEIEESTMRGREVQLRLRDGENLARVAVNLTAADAASLSAELREFVEAAEVSASGD